MNKNIWIPKFNYYSKRLSMWQEKLWDTVMPRPYAERRPSDDFIFCNNAYGMTSKYIHNMSHTVEPVRANIQMMTAVCVWNASNAAIAASANLDTTVTVGSSVYDQNADSQGPTATAFVYGYKSGSSTANSYHPLLGAATNVGSIANDTYTDGGSTSQTVTSINWSDNGIAGTPVGETDNIYFILNGTSRGDDNGTFTSFEYNGEEYLRSNRTTYTASAGGTETMWQYDNVTVNGPTSGTVDFLIFCS